MSEENVEIVRRMWEAFLAGDVPTALSFYAPDVEWAGTHLPDGTVGHGQGIAIGGTTGGTLHRSGRGR